MRKGLLAWWVLLASAWAQAEEISVAPTDAPIVSRPEMRRARLDVDAEAGGFASGRITAIATDLPVAVALSAASIGLLSSSTSARQLSEQAQLSIAVGVFALAAGLTLIEDVWIDRTQATVWFDSVGYVIGLLGSASLVVTRARPGATFDSVGTLATLVGVALTARLVLGAIPDREGISTTEWAVVGGLLGLDAVAAVVGALSLNGVMLSVASIAAAATLLIGRVVSAVLHARDASPGEVGSPLSLPISMSGWAGVLDKGRASTMPVAAGVSLRF